MNFLYTTNIDTPLGNLLALSDEQGICLLEFMERKKFAAQVAKVKQMIPLPILDKKNTHLRRLEKELKEYFSGKLQIFTVSLCFIGTDFQKKVWEELMKIPYGKTLSYSDLAIKIGNPKAVRAVANANAQNKICILIPCHRVIGKSGNLVGYAAGLDRKNKLLTLENSR